jgi:hypothetical protein
MESLARCALFDKLRARRAHRPSRASEAREVGAGAQEHALPRLQPEILFNRHPLMRVQIARLVFGPPQNQGEACKCDSDCSDHNGAFDRHEPSPAFNRIVTASANRVVDPL